VNPLVRPLACLAVGLPLAAIAAGAVCAAGCGKKGPPLAPVARVPARIEPFDVRRIGGTVYVQLLVPSANQDGSTPADLARVEVWAFTGDPGPIANFYRYGTVVAAFPVRRPPDPEEMEAALPGAKAGAPAAQPPGGSGTTPAVARRQRPPRDRGPGVDQGATVTVTEPITPQTMRLVLTEEQERLRRRPPLVLPAVPPPPPTLDLMAARIYIAVGVSRGGRRGPPSPRISIPLIDLPPVPAAPDVVVTEQAVTLRWLPPAGVRLPVQPPASHAPPAAAGQAPPAGEAPLPSKPIEPPLPGSAFQIVEVREQPAATPRPDLRLAVPRTTMPAGTIFEGALLAPPLNEKPLDRPSYDDTRVEFGARRCYAVRTVNIFGSLRIESEPSPPSCVTIVDAFPPAAPGNLAAVSGDGAVNLIWDPNTEKDLAGYLVLRGGSADGAMTPLTPEPIKETTFRDATVRPGTRYHYLVVAVDTASPPNASARTSRVEVVAR